MEISKQTKNQGEGSDAGSESDVASGAMSSGQSSEREVVVGATVRNQKFLRKRPKPGDGQGSSAEEGVSGQGHRRKIHSSRRGAARGKGVGRGLTTKEAGKPSRASPATLEKPSTEEESNPVGTSTVAAPTDSAGGEPDAAGGSKSEQAARFAEAVAAAIKGLALKRTQSSKDKAIPAVMASILAAAEAYHLRPPSDGMSETRAEVARLTAAMELLRKENEELRADLAGLRRAGPCEVPQGREQHGQGQPVPAEDRVLTLVRQEMASLRSRFSALEAIVLRPPLAASTPPVSGQRKAASYAVTAAASANPGSLGQTKSGAATQAARAPALTAKAPALAAGASALAAKAPALAAKAAALAAKEPPPPPHKATPADAEWQVAGEKRKAGKKNRTAQRKARRQRRKEQSVAARLRAPKSAAVVITLQPEAEKRGVSYRDVLAKVGAAVDLNEIGATEGIRVRVTATGARMLEVPGAASGPAADALAERLRASLNADEARVSRPTKCADMRILGLDDSVTEGQVVAAVVRTGGCSAEQVRAGAIRPDFTGMRAVTVSCPVSAAKKIAGEGQRLLVGWVSAQVKLLEPRPLRCFRCHVGNHVGAKCTSEVDRSSHCYRCGQPGHKAGSCEATPHCVVCAAAGKPAGHRIGSKACAPPAKARGKPPATAVTAATAATAAIAASTAVVAAAAAAAGPSQGAKEGAAMECQ